MANEQNKNFEIKVLVTGATGFIGSAVVKALLSEGYRVIGITRQGITDSIHSILKHKNFELVQIDLSKNFILGDVDVIVHAAAQASKEGAPIEDYVTNNVIAFKNLVDYAHEAKVKKFIYLSSISIYGEVKNSVVDENTPIINPHPYGITKYIGELLLHDCANFSSIALRLPGVLGKGAHGPWLVEVLKAAIKGENIAIYNPNANFNNMVDISDLCGLIIRLIHTKWAGSEAVTLGCAQPMTVKEVAEFLIKQVGSNSKIVAKQSNSNSFTISFEKAKSLFGYLPLTSKEILDRYVSVEVI